MTRPLLAGLPRPFAALVLVASWALVACDVPAAQAPHRPLPSYAGHAVELFDDTIEPAAVGISLDIGADPRSDRLLRERTQTGDATLRVRMTTVTSKEEDSGTRYLIGLHTLETLAGQFPPGENFEVMVGKSSPSTGILKAGLDGQLVGKTFVGFIRAFVRPDGDQELHFHLAPDSKQELAAIRDAAALAGAGL